MKSITGLADQLLERGPGELEEIRIHEFEDDESAHDEALVEQLRREFSADFSRAAADLGKRYGPPARAGEDDDDSVPLNGVFRFAVWEVEGQQLFLAAAQEDRGVPILLMMGTGDAD
jgi:hypothetical protein